MHATTPSDASLYVPDSHCVHEDAPADALYVPAPHTPQLPVPVVSELYWPAAHAVHTNDVEEPAASPYKPAAHAVHPLEPVPRALYVPTPHCRHTDDEVEPKDAL